MESSYKRFCTIATLIFAILDGAAEEATWWRSGLYPANWEAPIDERFKDSAFLQDYSYAGYRRGEVGLPAIAGPVFAVVGFGADPSGIEDSTSNIQAAIDAAANAGGGVVWLGEGTFRIAPPVGAEQALRIDHSGIVLRGAGTGKTFLLNSETAMRSRVVIAVRAPGGGNWRSASGAPVAVTADLHGPRQQIPVADAGTFAVGEWIVLRADATPGFIADLNMTDLWGGVDTAASLGGPLFYRQITAVDPAANTIGIDSPTRFMILQRDNARVVRSSQMIEEVGLEAFSIGNLQHPGSSGWAEEDYHDPTNAAYDTHASYLIKWQGVRNGWMRSVHSFQPAANSKPVHMLSNGVQLLYARSITMEDVRMQRPQYGGGGGNGYMIRFSAAQECLALDCIVEWNRHGFVFSGMQTSGNVIHRGLARRTAWQAEGGRTNGRGSDHHMHLSQSNLMDNVTLDEDFFQAAWRGLWGNVPHAMTATHSVFWNLEGLRYLAGKPFIVESEQFAYGYIIGTRGPAADVSLPRAQGARTDPIDHVEGVGAGDTLWPPSLYQDQLARRTGSDIPGPPSLTVVAPESVHFPDRRARLIATADTRNQEVVSISWRQQSGPRTAFIEHPDAPSTWVTVDLPGRYTFEVVATQSEWTNARTATIDFLPYSGDGFTIMADAATFVRDGSYADQNFGPAVAMEVKADGPGYARTTLLRFPTSEIARPVASAKLRMTSVAQGLPSMQHHIFMTDADTWQESTVTWNQQPAQRAQVGTIEVREGESWELDVTDSFNQGPEDVAYLIKASRNYGADGWMRYAGRTTPEQDQQPMLVVLSAAGGEDLQTWWATSPTLDIRHHDGRLRLQWPQDIRVATIPYRLEWNEDLNPYTWRPVTDEYRFADPDSDENIRLLEVDPGDQVVPARFFRLWMEP